MLNRETRNAKLIDLILEVGLKGYPEQSLRQSLAALQHVHMDVDGELALNEDSIQFKSADIRRLILAVRLLEHVKQQVLAGTQHLLLVLASTAGVSQVLSQLAHGNLNDVERLEAGSNTFDSFHDKVSNFEREKENRHSLAVFWLSEQPIVERNVEFSAGNDDLTARDTDDHASEGSEVCLRHNTAKVDEASSCRVIVGEKTLAEISSGTLVIVHEGIDVLLGSSAASNLLGVLEHGDLGESRLVFLNVNNQSLLLTHNVRVILLDFGENLAEQRGIHTKVRQSLLKEGVHVLDLAQRQLELGVDASQLAIAQIKVNDNYDMRVYLPNGSLGGLELLDRVRVRQVSRQHVRCEIDEVRKAQLAELVHRLPLAVLMALQLVQGHSFRSN